MLTTRCDLHVHSIRSGRVTLPVLGRFAHECYSEPAAVYEEARRKGMDFVTITDHDTIEGALEIAGRPGTFVSEEVTCELAGGRVLHLGVFGLAERQHERIARLRRDAEALFAYLTEERLPFCVNHLFSALTGRREVQDFHLALANVPLVEAVNGMMPPGCNAAAAAAGRRAQLGLVGGSDAHTLSSVARAYTAADAADVPEFLAALRHGATTAAGGVGSYSRLTADVARLVAGTYRESARRAALGVADAARFGALLVIAAVLPVTPFVTGALFLREELFWRRQRRRFLASTRRPAARRPASPLGPAAAASSSS